MVELMSLSRVEEVFGKFSYTEVGNGLISIDPEWSKANFVTFNFPIVGVMRCHKLVQSSFLKIFTEIEQQGLGQYINLKGGGGCYCPRHKLWDKKNVLSKHSWAICLDANVQANPYGKLSNLPLSFNESNSNTAPIIKIFESNQFVWGGRFRGTLADPMHWEIIPNFKPIVIATNLADNKIIDVSSSQVTTV